MLFRRNLHQGDQEISGGGIKTSSILPLTETLRKRFFSHHNLRDIVQSSQCDRFTYQIIRRHVSGILEHLGMPHNLATAWLNAYVQERQVKNLGQFEAELHASLAEDSGLFRAEAHIGLAKNTGIYEFLQERMQERAQLCLDVISPHLKKGESVLDLGGGSGEVANLMQAQGCKVTIADVLNWNKSGLPFVQVKDNHVALPDGSFDTVVVLTVFHHSDDPAALVSEAFRLAKNRVIFIESVTENPQEFAYGAWIDWFYNRVINYSPEPQKKINVPLHFLPSGKWEELVRTLTGLTPKVSQSLGIYQWLNPEHHHLFVYEKQ